MRMYIANERKMTEWEAFSRYFFFHYGYPSTQTNRLTTRLMPPTQKRPTMRKIAEQAKRDTRISCDHIMVLTMNLRGKSRTATITRFSIFLNILHLDLPVERRINCCNRSNKKVLRMAFRFSYFLLFVNGCWSWLWSLFLYYTCDHIQHTHTRTHTYGHSTDTDTAYRLWLIWKIQVHSCHLFVALSEAI